MQKKYPRCVSRRMNLSPENGKCSQIRKNILGYLSISVFIERIGLLKQKVHEFHRLAFIALYMPQCIQDTPSSHESLRTRGSELSLLLSSPRGCGIASEASPRVSWLIHARPH